MTLLSLFSTSNPAMPPDALPDVEAFFSDVACHGRVDGDAIERAVAAFVARHTNADGEEEESV